MKNRITIGLSSIILILLILCLSVFSLLSLSDAKTALSFAERRADSVKAYYEADSTGQQFLYELSLAGDGNPSPGAAMQAAVNIQAETGKSITVSAGEEDHILCDIPMPYGQSLHIELAGQDLPVLSYYVYNSEEYEIDDRLPVWDGSPK